MSGDIPATRGRAHAGTLVEADARGGVDKSMVMGLELRALLCRLSELQAQSSAESILFGYLAAASRATDNGTSKDKSTATISSRLQASGVNPAPSMRGKFLERERL